MKSKSLIPQSVADRIVDEATRAQVEAWNAARAQQLPADECNECADAAYIATMNTGRRMALQSIGIQVQS
jgi:hypothetical protein